jgi:hypothetical protein
VPTAEVGGPDRQIDPARNCDRFFSVTSPRTLVIFDDAAQARFAGLKRQKIRIATLDLRIASISSSMGATLLSR